MLKNTGQRDRKRFEGTGKQAAQGTGAGAPECCSSCGGPLMRKNKQIFRCSSCGREYYRSVDRTPKVSVRFSAGKALIICAAVLICITAAAVAGYQYYTGNLVRSAGRFSVVFRDFVMEVYKKPAAKITEEDLSRIKYLKIEKESSYRFTYSFEDYYDYEDFGSYEAVVNELLVEGKQDEFSPSNVRYFTGLTRLELYTEAWENYTLPEENQLRCIYCTDGLSRYGTPQFFAAVNPDTLEEVAVFGAGQLADFSFMEEICGIKRFTLEEAVLKSADLFDGFGKLEELNLCYPVVDEADAYGIVERILVLPSLRRFEIEGKAAWYLTDAQWEELRKKNPGMEYSFTDRGIVVSFPTLDFIVSQGYYNTEIRVRKDK